jgi:DNA invertase Pin-like site-specific DNA recombinase
MTHEEGTFPVSTTDTTPLRALLYLRVSDTHGRDDGISFETQERLGRELCDRRGWTVVDVLKDPDRKGSTMDRPGLNRARAAIPRDADVIVVWRMDRFSRSMLSAFVVLQEITEAGGAVVSTHAQEQLIDTSTAIGRGIAALLFSMGEEELDKIRTNWRYGIEKATAGGWGMGTTPFGLVKRGWRRPFEPHPVNADIVRALFVRAGTGASYERLRRWLVAEHDVHITTSTVRYILHNRVYLGEMNWSKDGKLHNKHAHEPIVDELTFRRAQRHGEKFGLGREKADPRLLSGVVRCAGCRSALRVIRATNRAESFSCRHLSGTDRNRCSAPVAISAPALEAYVERHHLIPWLTRWRLDAVDDTGLVELQSADARLRLIGDQLTEYNRLETQTALGERWLPGLLEREHELEAARVAHERVIDALNIPQALAALSQPGDYFNLPLDGKREILAAAFPMVFVRTDRSRGPGASSPEVLARRTRVIPRSVAHTIDLPQSGRPFDWRPFMFGDETEVASGEALGELG